MVPAQATSPSTKPRTAVIAFGGNALLKRGEDLSMDAQRRNAEHAAAAVARFVSDTNMRVCITHGNGPQVKLIVIMTTIGPLTAASCANLIWEVTSFGSGRRTPPQVGLLAQADAESGLDVLDAETEGQIGYILETELANVLNGGVSSGSRSAITNVVSLLTQVRLLPAEVSRRAAERMRKSPYAAT